MAVKDYETTAAGNDGTGKLFPEGILAAQLNNGLRDMQADLRLQANDPDFFEYGDGSGAVSINVLSGTSFRIVGSDQRVAYHENRRVRAVGPGTGTIYGSITGVTFASGNTDVTVEWDSGALAVEAAAIALGNMSATANSGFPRKLAGSFESEGNIKAANLFNPVQNTVIVRNATRSSRGTASTLSMGDFSFQKLSAAANVLVTVSMSYSTTTADFGEFRLFMGGHNRHFSKNFTENGAAKFFHAQALFEGSLTGISGTGTRTLNVAGRRQDRTITAIRNPNSGDSLAIASQTETTIVFQEV